MKIVANVIEIDQKPEDHYKAANWPGQGVYKVKGDSCYYTIGEYSVNTIYDTQLFTLVNESEKVVDESLVLKLIAAANGRVL